MATSYIIYRKYFLENQKRQKRIKKLKEMGGLILVIIIWLLAMIIGGQTFPY
jgi:uncharacterized membrane-anchored protein